MKREYLINEIAKLFNITKRTLQYYDKIDLLKPALIKENGYRVYGEDELTQLIEILILKNIGLNSRDIKSVFEEKTPKNIENVLNGVDKRLDDELRKIMFLKENIKHVKKSLNYENSSYDDIKIKTFEERKIVKIKNSGEDINNIIEMMALGTQILTETIENQIPFIEFGFIFHKDNKISNNYTKYANYFYTIPKNYKHNHTTTLTNIFYACSWFEGDLNELDKEIIKVLDWIDKKNYTIEGDIIFSESFSSLYYDDACMANGELQIPIKQSY
ncbi:MAG: MerR family transcriptional regulator [Marinisporobacter sp.]|jgi:DNA-binding transcriptional MerR regulator|nr:MerR family transcriptional regulator [Marinisporobacter sp.]